jgi:hypothetical protein
MDRGSIDEAYRAGGLTSEKYVLPGGQVWNEVEFLVDRAYTKLAGVPGVLYLDFTAFDQDLSSGLLISPAENLHQGRLTGAILAKQDVDFALSEIEAHIVQSDHPGEGLSDIEHFQDGVIVHCAIDEWPARATLLQIPVHRKRLL